MTPETGTTTSEHFFVPTDLELSTLRDLGWELADTADDFVVAVDFEAGSPCVEIPTSTGVQYQVMRSDDPDHLNPAGDVIEGDGSKLLWFDPNGISGRAFYRVEAFQEPKTLPLNKQAAQPAKSKATARDKNQKIVLPELVPHQCECHFH